MIICKFCEIEEAPQPNGRDPVKVALNAGWCKDTEGYLLCPGCCDALWAAGIEWK